MCLLFFELASQTDDGVGDRPNISVRWDVTGRTPNELFHLTWENPAASAATQRADSDFGAILLDRVVPEALGGTSRRYFTDTGYVFKASAPMHMVLDKTETDRTGQLYGPLPMR